MPSIRKPKRITIRGDDEKDYMFLVKGGEDLRLDQRIEQVSLVHGEEGGGGVYSPLFAIRVRAAVLPGRVSFQTRTRFY